MIRAYCKTKIFSFLFSFFVFFFVFFFFFKNTFNKKKSWCAPDPDDAEAQPIQARSLHCLTAMARMNAPALGSNLLPLKRCQYYVLWPPPSARKAKKEGLALPKFSLVEKSSDPVRKQLATFAIQWRSSTTSTCGLAGWSSSTRGPSVRVRMRLAFFLQLPAPHFLAS